MSRIEEKRAREMGEFQKQGTRGSQGTDKIRLKKEKIKGGANQGHSLGFSGGKAHRGRVKAHS